MITDFNQPLPQQEYSWRISPVALRDFGSGCFATFREMPRSFEKKDEEEDKREGQGPALPSWQPEPEHGDLERFIRYCRTSKCPDFQAGHCELHKPMQCFHFHFEGQRRRGVLGLDGKLCYWELPCKWISQPNKCHLGERCIFAHSKGEISYHPAKYKTRLCNGGDCQKATCCFAHSEKELRSKAVARYSHGMAAERPKESKESKEQEEPKEEPKELKESDEGLSGGPRSLGASGSGATSANARSLEAVDLKTFKVFPCRKGRGVHDRKLCAFYHNPRDRRRPPACGYRPEPCPEPLGAEREKEKEQSLRSEGSQTGAQASTEKLTNIKITDA
ncbi:UNK [Symbiodinium microadriaticum]|nr:UNK [Symbiodinium microadriaticum]